MLAKSYRTAATFVFFLGILWLGQASAKADTITFESDPLGFLSNGGQSVESNLVRFSATGGGALIINENFGVELIGTRGLIVSGSPNVHLVMDFAVPVNSLSLFFGNDDPIDTAAGDAAILRVFFDGSLVGETVLLVNGNDIADQQITFSGPAFNSATFHFSHEFFLSEAVDNIEFTPVPEPASVAVLGIAIAGIVAKVRRRGFR
jgi:PEP-CTERM motif